MVYRPEFDKMDRPRGILSEADREYLVSDKSGYSNQAQYKRENAIKKRVSNALLDFSVLENYLDEDLREEIFESFDLNNVFEEETELYSTEDHYIGCLIDMVAFTYRETNEKTGFHPPFSQILETGIVAGEYEPRTIYYGQYNVDISFEKIDTETVSIPAVAERIKKQGSKSLTEAEMRSFIDVISRSEALDSEKLRDEFSQWIDEFEEETSRPPQSIDEIFAQMEHGNPFGIKQSRDGENDE